MPITMKTALYLGQDSQFRKLLSAALADAGYYTYYQRAAGMGYDLIIDAASSSATELRSSITGNGTSPEHYILISSCAVYPSTMRLRPWVESDADVCEDMLASLPAAVQTARKVERELRLLASNRFPFSVLRPSIVEGEGFSNKITNWMVDRILNGGMIVLPEGDLPKYRHVSSADLARAVATIAGRPEAFGQTMNVTGQGMLGYWGHAAMLRDGLQHDLRFEYVPTWRWRAACLTLPLGEVASSSLIEPSQLLHDLGWRPTDEPECTVRLAQQSAGEQRMPDHHLMELERRVLDEAEAEREYTPGIPPYPLPVSTAKQRVLRGWAGQPGSLTLERVAEAQPFPSPVVKIQALALCATEEKLLKGEYPLQLGHRAIGHNALLEIVTAGEEGPKAGDLAIPLSLMPCDTPGCPFCANGSNGVLGIGCNGYGWGVCTTPPSHLLPVPPELGKTALLANPLGSLLWALSAPLAESDGPVWIAGRTVEAALAVWLAEDAGRPVVLVDRRAWEHPEFPVSAVEDMLKRVRSNELPTPTLAIDFTSNGDVSWPLAQSLKQGSSIWVRSRPPGIPHGIHWHQIPAAPSRSYLEQALSTLQRWHSQRNLALRISSAIPFDLYWDALLPYPFALPCLEEQP
jgi:nucleoside-diphosphate-sugar epimerase